VHELSLIYSVVETVEQSAKQARAASVVSVKLRIGALSGVVKDALLFCYDVAAEDTMLAGSRLDLEEVPVAIYCEPCAQVMVLPGVQSFRCPACDTPSGDIRQGRELDIVSIELEVP
jgi:hydrogenase nickel incorporation protein HypA/HybF